MGPARCVIIIALCLFISSRAFCQGQLLLIDRSGSMKPYYEQSLVSELGTRIVALMQAHSLGPVQVGAFNDHVEIVPDVNSIVVGGATYMDTAFDYAVEHHYSLVWMITDNIMHRSGEEEGRTRVFYDRLKGEAVGRLVIFPLKQSQGGHPGLMVYAMLMSPAAKQAFEEETKDFQRQTKGSVLLPMKPLDRDTIDATFADASIEKNGPVYTDGSVIQRTVEVRFKSRFEHLRIVDADIVNPRVSPEFSKNSLLRFEKTDVKITPEKIIELGPGNETVQVYRVSIDLGQIQLKHDPISLWRAALRNPNEEISLDLSFAIKVPKENFQFTDTFLRDYGAETTESAKAEGKIYDLRELPLLVAENRTSIDVPNSPKIRVRYPSWLFLIFPGIPIAAILILIAVTIYIWRVAKRLARRRPKWIVDVQRPPQSDGKIRSGWVIVTVDGRENRLGQIKGTRFVPAPTVKPKEPIAIKEGMPISLNLRARDYMLIFRSGVSEDGVNRHKRGVKGKDGKRVKVEI